MRSRAIRLIQGDCREVLPTLAEGSADSVACDPPYELGFMGKSWDRTGVAFDPQTWRHVLRVLKPGGYATVFGGTRTYHRLACAVEDAGFEIRDCLMWMYGTGFPKGQGCLKPAWEPILLCRKPGKRVLPLGIDACRIPGEPWKAHDATGLARDKFFTAGPCKVIHKEPHEGGRYPANVVIDDSEEVAEAFAAFGEKTSRGGSTKRCKDVGYRRGGVGADTPNYGNDTGTAARFFAKCEFTDEEAFIRSAKAIMETWNQSHALTAKSPSSLSSERAAIALSDAVTRGSHGGRLLSDAKGLTTSVTPSELRRLGESVIALTLSTERRYSFASGLGRLSPTLSPVRCVVNQTPSGTTEITTSHWKSDGSAAPVTFSITPTCSEPGVPASESTLRFNYCAKASKKERGKDNTHPTVKPLKLCEWLVRLVCPEGGTVLDPFMGSGSVGVACVKEGRRFVGIEMDASYATIARQRIDAATKEQSRSLFPG